MSMNKLLRSYLRLAVQEAHLARVPNQLISADEENADEGDEDVNEFCGVGSAGASSSGNMMGFSGPLGGGSSFPKRKKKRTKK